LNTRYQVPTVVASLCFLLAGCDWVDSTGNQGVVPQTEVFLDDAPVNGVIALMENAQARIVASRDSSALDEQTYVWSEALAEGNLPICAAQDGFNPDFAAASLAEACTDPVNCNVDFKPVETADGVGQFELVAPQLQASVGMRYGLTITDLEGLTYPSEYTLCLIAVNEAPSAIDDTFVVREGIREVFAGATGSLLSNDEDDVDVSNNKLAILPEPASAPASAAFFDLREDGSFTYESSLDGITADQFDSFEYTLTDGEFTSTAKVTLRIVTSNQAPEQLDAIPLLEAEEGEPFAENLALYFEDPEAGDLTFSLDDADELPSNGSLDLSPNGLLSGSPDEDDVGSHVFTLIVSDGGREINALVALEIVPAPVVVENSAPVFVDGSVFNQIIVLGREIRAVVPEFEDADLDELTYAIAGLGRLPTGVTIDEDTGIVSGEPAAKTWVRDLRIEATDPFGESALSDPFYIRVR